jgi:Uma2 family endonuclease
MHIDIEPPYLIVKPGLTEEDFYRLADEDSDWEFLDGRIVMHSPASNRHEALFGFLLTLLNAYVGEQGGAVVRGSRYPMRLDADWSPEPDIMVIRHGHCDRMLRKYLDGPADLVIEIASDSDPRLDLREKFPRYRDAGVDEMWLIDPFSEQVRAETRSGGAYETAVVTGGRLGSVVVPGFWIDVAWLWQEELPAPWHCLRVLLG